mmetsp:Transcript_36757/g.118859  ORF Transcript_36757/g.118859 Transcript_36757/m.118859 type:complete len:271 (+) Transcript_36757:122-934(+)
MKAHSLTTADSLLRCVSVPEEKLLRRNVEERIQDFLASSTEQELAFQPDLAKADRALVHTLAQRHGLRHRSTGKGSERFITVSKREGGVTEAVLEAQFSRAHAMGYSLPADKGGKRGMGLGFGARSYTAAPPPASLLRLCRTDLPQDVPPQHAARSSAATKNKPLAAKRFPKPPPPPQLLAPPPPPPPLSWLRFRTFRDAARRAAAAALCASSAMVASAVASATTAISGAKSIFSAVMRFFTSGSSLSKASASSTASCKAMGSTLDGLAS